jgi:Skp family chaperone for outer membrane proteins
MKFARILVSLLGLASLGLTSFAQAPAAPAPAPKMVPLTRVAWLNSSAFIAETGGIKQLVRIVKELDLEFSGQQSELSLMGEKLRTIVGELNKLKAGGEANAEAFRVKQDEGIKLQQELQARQQAFQQAVQQVQQQKQAPVAAELSKAIAAFAKEREIGMLFDAAKMGDALISAQPELEVTQEFIAYFNEKHP